MIGCGCDERRGLKCGRESSVVRDPAAEQDMRVRAEDLLQEGLVREYRNVIRVKSGTLKLVSGRLVHTDG